MLKKIIVTALCVILILIAPIAQSQQNEPAPLYSVTFETFDNVYIATAFDDLSWRVTPLPSGMVFGQLDVFFLAPKWSDDGQKAYLGMGAEDTGEDEYYSALPNDLYSFDTHTGEIQFLYHVLNEEESFRGFHIVSLSPDEHYIWLTEIGIENATLLDLTTGEVIFESPCRTYTVKWLADSVFVSDGAMYCDTFQHYVLDLPQGEKRFELQPYEQESIGNPWISGAHLLPDGSLLIGCIDHSCFNQAFGRVNLTDENVEYLGLASEIQLSGSETALFYSYNDTLTRMNLETLESEQVSEAAFSPRWIGDTLTFWESHSAAIYHVSLGEEKSKDVIFEGDMPDDYWPFPSDEPALLIAYPGEDHSERFQIYNTQGMVFNSDA